MIVSIHAPARGATSDTVPGVMMMMFQSTHPRGVRHVRRSGGENEGRVSIHAPARGATPRLVHYTGQCYVSIHAPARGATVEVPSVFPALTSFNPRTREGCDGPAPIIVFIPSAFQSTHPRGVRQRHGLMDIIDDDVSIHAPARGATGWDCFTYPNLLVSIHAPARGATDCDDDGYIDLSVSIHAPARGATGGKHYIAWTRAKFQSTHPRGVRHHRR